MKSILVLILISFLQFNSFAQEQLVVNESVTVTWEKFSQNEKFLLTAFDIEGNEFYSKIFSHPFIIEIDLDIDFNNELIIIDSSFNKNFTIYITYIYSTLDTFYLIDSIYSPVYFPNFSFFEEVEGNLIVVGDNDFTQFIKEEEENPNVPISVWKYEEGELFNVNDEIYDIFIVQNENLLNILDNFTTINNEDCSEIEKNTSVIVAIYVNYIRANEISYSQQFMKRYYLCSGLSRIFNTLNFSE